MVTTPADALPLRGNNLAVDFVNTVADVRTGKGEYLPTALDLALWGRHAGAIDARAFNVIADDIRKHPDRAKKAHRRALRLRSALSRIFLSQAALEDLMDLDRLRVRVAQSRSLVPGTFGYTLDWTTPATLDLVIARIVDAALELLTSGRVANIKQCDGPPCGWLFLDESRTRQRRWCSMQDCGNRAKVRRFRQQQGAL